MKKTLIISFLSTSLLSSISLPAFAGGADYYRNLTSNNILNCPTKRQIETFWEGGNSTNYGSEYGIICLENERKAKWIIQSNVTCQNGKVTLEKCPILTRNQYVEQDNKYTFKAPKVGIGSNCHIQTAKAKYSDSLDYNWACEKYSTQNNLTIITKGNERLRSTIAGGMTEATKHSFELQATDQPECKKDSNLTMCYFPYPLLGEKSAKFDPKTYITCLGDAEFCDWAYRPFDY